MIGELRSTITARANAPYRDAHWPKNAATPPACFGRQQGGCPPRSLYAPVLWAGSALPIELNLIITIDADLPTPQTPPSPPILMRGGMERPVWCFHPQGLG